MAVTRKLSLLRQRIADIEAGRLHAECGMVAMLRAAELIARVKEQTTTTPTTIGYDDPWAANAFLPRSIRRRLEAGAKLPRKPGEYA